MNNRKILSHDLTSSIGEITLINKKLNKYLSFTRSKIIMKMVAEYPLLIYIDTYYPSTAIIENTLTKYFD